MVHLGHANGTVSLWSPNQGKPLVKMLTHKGAVSAIGMDRGGHVMATAGLDGQLKVWDLRTYKMTHAYRTDAPASTMAISDRGMLALGFGKKVQLWGSGALKAKQKDPYMNHELTAAVGRVSFAPFEDVLGVSHDAGFESVIVPGAGEPNFDSLEANPYETRRQRSEKEVQQLLEKLPPDTIVLNPEEIGGLRRAVSQQQRDKKTIMSLANNKGPVKQRKRMKGKGSASKRVRRKQTNVIDAKLQLAREQRAQREAEAKKRRQAKEIRTLLSLINHSNAFMMMPCPRRRDRTKLRNFLVRKAKDVKRHKNQQGKKRGSKKKKKKRRICTI